MNTTDRFITVNGIKVQVVRKNIKNLNLSVRPPDGKVRVAVPKYISDDNVRLAVISKYQWIKKQQARFEGRPVPSPVEMVAGESHYLFGRRYALEVIERYGRHEIAETDDDTLVLYVRQGTTVAGRKQVLNEWYRDRLKEIVPVLLKKWQPVVGEEVREWGIKRMKTRWGSCNTRARRIWLNLELAKKNLECIEYVLVHELVHLVEPSHNKNFKDLMGRFIPEWRAVREVLNSDPAGRKNE